MEQRFTSSQVVSLTGITPRQLQWWDECGIVSPQREGRRRLYTLDDVTEIAVICALRRKGFPLQRVRTIVKFLQKEFGKRLAAAVSGGSEYHLLTDGKNIYVENSERQVIDILNEALLTHNYIMIRKETSFVVYPADTPILDAPRIARQELPKRRQGRQLRVERIDGENVLMDLRSKAGRRTRPIVTQSADAIVIRHLRPKGAAGDSCIRR